MKDERTLIFNIDFMTPQTTEWATGGSYLVHRFIEAKAYNVRGKADTHEAMEYTDRCNTSAGSEIEEIFGRAIAMKLRMLKPGQGATWDQNDAVQILVHRIS